MNPSRSLTLIYNIVIGNPKYFLESVFSLIRWAMSLDQRYGIIIALHKGSVPLRRSENIRKIENEYFVHCLVSWCSLMFKLLSEKMPVFKIEYLSSNNRFFRVGVLCLHWNPIENKPRPTFKALKKYERSDVTFS